MLKFKGHCCFVAQVREQLYSCTTTVQSHRYKVPSDGALISPNQRSFGTLGQTKVSDDRQTNEICCLAAEF